jgi:hypothetical protein
MSTGGQTMPDIMGKQHSCCTSSMETGMTAPDQDKGHLQSSCDCMITAASTTAMPVEVGFNYTLTANDFLPVGSLSKQIQSTDQQAHVRHYNSYDDQLASASPPLHLQHGVFLN